MLWNFFAAFSLHITKVGSLSEAKVCTRAAAAILDELLERRLVGLIEGNYIVTGLGLLLAALIKLLVHDGFGFANK